MEVRCHVLRPLGKLRVGDHVIGTITSYAPWGLIAKLQDVEPVGASLDMIRRQTEPGVHDLAQRRPAIGTSVEFVIAQLRPWHHAPWVWVDLTMPDRSQRRI